MSNRGEVKEALNEYGYAWSRLLELVEAGQCDEDDAQAHELLRQWIRASRRVSEEAR